eukprot:gene2533-728_t
MARVHCLVVVPFIFLCIFVVKVHSLSFTLSAGTKKCLREEVHKDVLVTGEFRLSEAPIKTHLTVVDTNNHVLYKKQDAQKGKFAFTTDDYDMFEVCFESEGQHGQGIDREIFLDVKTGVEAKNYDDLAKVEKLKPMELELKKLEDLSEAIVNDFAYMRSREEEMRDTNGWQKSGIAKNDIKTANIAVLVYQMILNVWIEVLHFHKSIAYVSER